MNIVNYCHPNESIRLHFNLTLFGEWKIKNKDSEFRKFQYLNITCKLLLDILNKVFNDFQRDYLRETIYMT